MEIDLAMCAELHNWHTVHYMSAETGMLQLTQRPLEEAWGRFRFSASGQT